MGKSIDVVVTMIMSMFMAQLAGLHSNPAGAPPAMAALLREGGGANAPQSNATR